VSSHPREQSAVHPRWTVRTASLSPLPCAWSLQGARVRWSGLTASIVTGLTDGSYWNRSPCAKEGGGPASFGGNRVRQLESHNFVTFGWGSGRRSNEKDRSGTHCGRKKLHLNGAAAESRGFLSKRTRRTDLDIIVDPFLATVSWRFSVQQPFHPQGSLLRMVARSRSESVCSARRRPDGTVAAKSCIVPFSIQVEPGRNASGESRAWSHESARIRCPLLD